LWREGADDEPEIVLPAFANAMLAGEAGMRKSDDLGRLTRALPLYLEEALQVRFRVRARAALFVARNHGPAVMGGHPDRATLEEATASPLSAAMGTTLAALTARRIIAAGSLDAGGVTLRIWEVGRPDEPVDVSVAVSLADPGVVAAAVERALVGALKQRAVLLEASPPAFHRAPAADLLGRVRAVPGAALLSADRGERAGARRFAVERARILRELRRAGRGVAERTRVRAPDRDLRNDRRGGVQVGARRAVPEDRAPLGRRGRGRQRRSAAGARDLQAPGRAGALRHVAAARARARRRALHGLAGAG
jgi:hypothetical protein